MWEGGQRIKVRVGVQKWKVGGGTTEQGGGGDISGSLGGGGWDRKTR